METIRVCSSRWVSPDSMSSRRSSSYLRRVSHYSDTTREASSESDFILVDTMVVCLRLILNKLRSTLLSHKRMGLQTWKAQGEQERQAAACFSIRRWFAAVQHWFAYSSCSPESICFFTDRAHLQPPSCSSSACSPPPSASRSMIQIPSTYSAASSALFYSPVRTGYYFHAHSAASCIFLVRFATSCSLLLTAHYPFPARRSAARTYRGFPWFLWVQASEWVPAALPSPYWTAVRSSSDCRATHSCAAWGQIYPEVVEILRFQLEGVDHFVMVGAVDLAAVGGRSELRHVQI